MFRRVLVVLLVIAGFLLVNTAWVGATNDKEIEGVKFPGEIVIEGKTLHLNGVAYRKALGFVKIYAAGLYLEKPTKDSNEVIESEQVKHLVTHYLTDKVSADKLQAGFVDVIKECNSKELVEAHQDEINTYAKWMDKDTKPGLISTATYVPGKGLTLTYQGEEKGTIPGKEFAQMYYRLNVGEKAYKKVRKGLLDQ